MSLLIAIVAPTTGLSGHMQGGSSSELSAAPLPQEPLGLGAEGWRRRRRRGSLVPSIFRQVPPRDSEVSERSEVTLIHTMEMQLWGRALP